MTKNELFEVVNPLVKMEFNVNETLTLLVSNGFKYWSWGVSQKINYRNKGLLLKVSGHHHKGLVLITLDWSDTYSVHIISNKGVIQDTFEGVYFDNLFDVIDNRIEFIEKYKV
jgi:hypothetical protein